MAKGSVPQRRCVVCRRLRSRSEQARLSAPQRNGAIVPNPLGDLGGKGFYICLDGDCFKRLHSDKKLRKTLGMRIDEATNKWIEEQVLIFAQRSSLQTPSQTVTPMVTDFPEEAQNKAHV